MEPTQPPTDAAADDKERERDVSDGKEREHEDTSNDEALARAVADGRRQDIRRSDRVTPSGRRTTAVSSEVKTSAKPAATAAAAAGAAAMSNDIAPAAAAAPGSVSNRSDLGSVAINLFDSNMDGFDAEKLEELGPGDAPLSTALIRLGAAVVSGAKLLDPTVVLFNVTLLRSKAKSKSGEDAAAYVFELLKVSNARAKDLTELYRAVQDARTHVTDEKVVGPDGDGFFGVAADPMVNVHVLIRMKATSEAAAEPARGQPFDAHFTLSTSSEKQVAERVIAHLQSAATAITPKSVAAERLMEVLKTIKTVSELKFGTLQLAAFRIGPLSTDTTQAQVDRLADVMSTAARAYVFRRAEQTLPNALVIVPCRYAAKHTIRRTKEDGIKHALTNRDSVCVEVMERPVVVCKKERASFEAMACTALAMLGFPEHFAVEKLTRRRLCLQCLRSDHGISRCPAKPMMCLNCCSSPACKPPCRLPTQCAICSKSHKTAVCPDYRGRYAEPSDVPAGLKHRPVLADRKPVALSTLEQVLLKRKEHAEIVEAQRLTWRFGAKTDYVLGEDTDSESDDGKAPMIQLGMWTALIPTPQLNELVTKVAYQMKVTPGRAAPKLVPYVPPIAAFAKSYVESCLAADKGNANKSRLAHSGLHRTELTTLTDLPQALAEVGLTAAMCWSYGEPKPIERLDPPAPPGPVGRRNRRDKQQSGKNLRPKRDAADARKDPE